jgi:hypothetical protein
LTPSSTPTSTFTPTPTAAQANTPTDTPTPASSNLALSKSVSVSSYQDISHIGGMAVDGDLATYWQSKKAVGKNVLPSEWIVIDLGDIATISSVQLEWDAYYATSYLLQISNDGANWVTVFTTNAGDGGNDIIQLNSVSGRYVRMDSTTWSNSSSRNWLREFEIFGYYASPLPTNTPTPTSLSNPTITTTPTPTSGSTASVHVGDIDGLAQLTGKNWKASVVITIHDGNHNPVPNATINGTWSDGYTGSCLTDVTGYCTITSSKIASGANTITFTISNVAYSSSLYRATDNHDPDGDSDGSSITVQKP